MNRYNKYHVFFCNTSDVQISLLRELVMSHDDSFEEKLHISYYGEFGRQNMFFFLNGLNVKV